jgi:hypothetical protein
MPRQHLAPRAATSPSRYKLVCVLYRSPVDVAVLVAILIELGVMLAFGIQEQRGNMLAGWVVAFYTLGAVTAVWYILRSRILVTESLANAVERYHRLRQRAVTAGGSRDPRVEVLEQLADDLEHLVASSLRGETDPVDVVLWHERARWYDDWLSDVLDPRTPYPSGRR